jgi:2-polyprenyl-6-methoxyphenol hydroxylase-like FAD-dependent oxidoreductase
MKVAICGVGIAGGTLAYWLLHAGHQPVLIEEAPSLRTGGYIMDFWGLGYTVAERMGLRESLHAAGYAVEEIRFVDDGSRAVGGFAVDALRELTHGRMTSLPRGELAAAIYGTIRGRVETILGDTIAAIHEHAQGVRITLEGGTAHDVDIVVGADGLHSRVRQLVFGEQSRFEKDLNYRVAAFEVPGYRPRDEDVYIMHAATSRQLARFALRDDRTLFLFVFRAGLAPEAMPTDRDGTRAFIRSVYGDVGWEAPQILDALDAAQDIYFDRVSQIKMDTWHKGRVVLVGDAGMALSLMAGEGAGLAMTEAYVLAGELERAGGEHQKAFLAYENQLRAFVEGKQKAAANFASSFVPETHFGIWVRNQATKLMGIPGVANLLLGRSMRDDMELPDYFEKV